MVQCNFSNARVGWRIKTEFWLKEAKYWDILACYGLVEDYSRRHGEWSNICIDCPDCWDKRKRNIFLILLLVIRFYFNFFTTYIDSTNNNINIISLIQKYIYFFINIKQFYHAAVECFQGNKCRIVKRCYIHI